MTRAERRNKFAKAVDRAARYLQQCWSFRKAWKRQVVTHTALREDVRLIRKMAETHCRPCSCHMCKNHKDVLPKRERGFDEREGERGA